MKPRIAFPSAAVALALVVACGPARAAAPEPRRSPLTVRSVEEKGFYVLSLLETTPEVARLLREDAVLARIAAASRKRLAETRACAAETACLTTALRFRADEVEEAAVALRALYRESAALRKLVDVTMRESGVFQRYAARSGEELLVAAWKDAAAGASRIVDVYADGRAPLYPAIDSPMTDVASERYRHLMQTAVDVERDADAEPPLFFQAPLRFALRLLAINLRDEAARLEPLHLGENRETLARLGAIRWSDFPYSAILVPGSGPDRVGVSLSPWGRLRLDLAVKRFRERKAPLLIVSGGYVHPSQTAYCEAIEMKRALVADYGVPADAILVEPHARHTTTNIRNAARLVWRYGMPFEKPLLVTTDVYHTDMIAAPEFMERCDRELGVRPFRLVRRVSPFDLEILPTVDSLHAEAADPLDP